MMISKIEGNYKKFMLFKLLLNLKVHGVTSLVLFTFGVAQSLPNYWEDIPSKIMRYVQPGDRYPFPIKTQRQSPSFVKYLLYYVILEKCFVFGKLVTRNGFTGIKRDY